MTSIKWWLEYLLLGTEAEDEAKEKGEENTNATGSTRADSAQGENVPGEKRKESEGSDQVFE